MLITLEQAKAEIEMDHDLSDDMIQEKVDEQSDALLNYLKRPEGTWQDTSGAPADVPGVIQAAVKMMVCASFENRDGNPDGPQPLSQAVKDLVHRYRDPAMA